ncbi:MAG: AMP-binding protein [Oceanicoccus sp.]
MISLKKQIDNSREAALTGMDIPWLLDQWVQRVPDKDFMIWEPFSGVAESWTYGRIQQEAKRIAASLAAIGVRSGDFVIIHLENCPEFILSWFACAELGAVAVSTNTRSVARDMRYYAEHTQAVCAITQPEFVSMVSQSCLPETRLIVTDNDAGVAADVPKDVAAIAFAELLDTAADDIPERPIDTLLNLSVQFTSGTTSRPKAVLWTQANGIWAGKISASHMKLRHEDKTLIFMPMFHTNAQGYSMLATLWVGGTFVMQPKFSASRFWPISLKYDLTWLSTIPFAIKAISDQSVPEHSYRFWGTAAHLPALTDRFGVAGIGWWGMTETLTHGIVTDIDQPGPHGTIGRVAPEYEIQIRTSDGGVAGPGERGLLFIRGVRGVTLFKEYYGNPEANDKAFDTDGWFDTGDIIRIGDDGYLYFSDRDKDMLKVGAENVAASEIESVIVSSGLVAECAVVAQKHFMLDEVPVAFVIPASHPAADLNVKLLSYCRDNLADFKVPHDIHVVDELPRSTLEKVAKNELRSRLPAIDS